MSTWSEQISAVQKLREQRRQADDELYAVQLELLRSENALRKIRNEEASAPVDTKAIEALRTKIAELEKQLQELSKKIKAIDDLSEKVRQVNEKTNFIEKKLQSLPPDQKKLEQELKEQLNALRKNLEALRRQLQQAEAELRELEAQRQRLQRSLNALQEELKDKLTPQPLPAGPAEEKKNALEERKKRARAALDAAINNLQLAVEEIYVNPHPSSIVSNLDDSIPFLFLPVRIETRFKTTGDLRELWLRIYPDDIAVHTHEKTLTDEEIVEGEKYWTFIFDAEKTPEEEREQLKKDAWTNIVSLFSAQRSAWVAMQTKPLNWDQLPDLESAGQMDFPQHAQSKPFEWSRAPRTNVLPDKFVITFYQGESVVKEIVGPVIQDELYMGPDPLESEGAFKEAAEDNMLVFGTEYEWTSDFDKAIEKGMGFKIPLSVDEATKGFDKILVLGLYASADQTEGKQAVETMIDNHHYSSKGFAIVKQGTPTNNTEQEASGFSTKDPFDEISFFVETGKPLFEDNEECDGKNLADALGIEYDPLKFVLNSDAKERREAIAMNTALYPSTLGYYFGTMMKPVFNDANQDTIRNFFITHVSGAGPLPAIRIGSQPYGILLTSDFSKWQWKQREGRFGNPFLTMLYRVLDHYHTIWKSLLPQLQYTGKPNSDPSEVMMNILGLQSGSVSFFQRNGFSTETLKNRDEFEYNGRYFDALVESYVSKGVLRNFLADFGYVEPIVNGKPNIPQLFRLVYQHYHTRLNAANVIENFPLSETDGLHPYVADKNYIDWLIETTTVAELEKQNFGSTVIKPPTSLLYMQLRRSLLLAMADASVKWWNRHDFVLDQVMEVKSFHNIRPQRDLTKWEAMKGKVAIALPNHPQAEMAIAEHLLTTGSGESEAAYLNRIKESLGFLAGRPTAALERRFCEHVDTCSYRLDAWQTALFDQRLKKQRHSATGGDQPDRKKGIYLGAFGWVEDIRPSNKQQIAADTLPEKLRPPVNKPVIEYADNGGFVHAPSINQATAAAVLRSGYLSHATTATPDTMAVNLSSERVRRALFILEGMRNGQTLEALLGFQFERGLHDRGSANDDLKRLNEYIYDFRDEFTVQQHAMPQVGVPEATTETIERKNIVNGLTLAETTKAYPYDVTLDLSGLTPPQVAAIEEAIKEEKDRLEDTLDALKDLFLSESVFQMVQGNFDRAAAVTTALKDATIPPEIEVIDTPPTNHLSFTNRVTIQFDSSASFSGANQRAKMEPGINQWLRIVIGEPADLICLLSHMSGDVEEQMEISIADCNLEPIDLLYIVGNDFGTGKNNAAASEIETRLVHAYRDTQGLADDVTVKIQFVGTVTSGNKIFLGNILPATRKLKQIVTDSRPVNAQDFQPTSKESLADKTNPHGYMIDELRSRIEDAREDFDRYLTDLRNIAITITEGVTSEDKTLGEVFDDLDADAINFTDILFSLSVGNALDIQFLLKNISGFGLSDSFPQVKDITNDSRKLILLEQARNTARSMTTLLEQADELLVSLPAPENDTIQKKVDLLIKAGKIFFGDVFNILPRFIYSNPGDIQLSNANRTQLLKHAIDVVKMQLPADEWMQKVSPVRPSLARWDDVRTIYELYHDDQIALFPVQLPYRSNDSWLAVDFPETFTINDDTLSIVIHGEPAFSTVLAQCGILVDEWTEVVPGREALTGLTFNYNQPDAMPPQALLLAVTPEETGAWGWDKLLGILNDTLQRAKLRAVEPQLLDTLQRADTGVLLPAILSTFSQHGLDISLDYRLNVAFYENSLPLSSIG